MSIVINQDQRTFHLSNEKISYIIEIMANGQLGQLYFGAKISEPESFNYLHEDQYRSMGAMNRPYPELFTLNFLKQEYPSFGTSDFRSPAFQIRRENGSEISNFTYVSYEIKKGKQTLPGLPSTYVNNNDEAETLIFTLFDEVTETKLLLFYTLFRDYPIITRHAEFYQEGTETLILERALSLNLDLPDANYNWMQLYGAWGRERYPEISPLHKGIQAIQSMKGASSAEHNPFVALLRPETNEEVGEVIAFSLIYSGNFLAQIEVNTDDETRISIGIHNNNFHWRLNKGDSFITPEAVLLFSESGLGGMSRTFHKFWNNQLVRGAYKLKPRPILLNNWEATTMNFDEEMILKIARKAADAGAELFVLDDGWFGERNHEHAGLGDWKANLLKLPNGISGLSEKIEAMGLKFGLWFEPEMVNEDSDMFRTHPDYLLSDPERFRSPSRYQYVLDFSKPEVVDNIFGQMSNVIRPAKISYIKWDMNRYITEAFSQNRGAEIQGEVMHRYILGVYDLYDRLTTDFPHILFESCSSGGARFDPGLLYYAPQAWASDDSDAVERYKIQYGTSFVYPISSIGAHVSAVPNQQVNRSTPLSTRANVAFYGAFGYELDLQTLNNEEFTEVKQQIAFYKENRYIFQYGTFYRLESPFDGNTASWISVDEEKENAFMFYGQTLELPNLGLLRVYPRGLNHTFKYKVDLVGARSKTEQFNFPILPGDVIERAGLPINRKIFYDIGGDFASILIKFTKV